ncbi:MAG: hypothetical protein RIC81_09205 [Microcella pacifica]|uniref:hypothetical protein n=1 Tax=Microcella pacifica TaxID=2591847 RepID=UPI003316244C
MSSTPSPAPPTPAPPTPASLFVWAMAWAAVAALGFFVLMLNSSQAAGFAFAGQRTFGIVVIVPALALVLAVICVVRGVRAIVPHRDYQQQWSAAERQRAERTRLAGQPSTPFIVFSLGVAVVWGVGVVAVIAFFPSLSSDPDGFSLAVMLLALLLMLWVPVLRAGVRRRAADRPDA